jgi:hypothetical protein
VFTASNGKSFSSLTMGTKSADNMFSGAKSSNKVTAWIFRIIGIVLVIIGFSMLLGPLSVIADVIPFLGSIVGAGTGFCSVPARPCLVAHCHSSFVDTFPPSARVQPYRRGRGRAGAYNNKGPQEQTGSSLIIKA